MTKIDVKINIFLFKAWKPSICSLEFYFCVFYPYSSSFLHFGYRFYLLSCFVPESLEIQEKVGGELRGDIKY
jgi:hypothetical protein